MKSPASSIATVRASVFVVVAVAAALLTYSGIFGVSHRADAASTDNISGYAWSGGSDTGEGIGWISFNCTNEGNCGSANGSYGVTVNTTTGELSGWAWADPRDDVAPTDNIGWISFNSADLTGCPSAPSDCTAKVDLTTGAVTGWARAHVATVDPQAKWDGWISLSCKNDNPGCDPNAGTPGSYGVSVNTTTGKFSGFAWGEIVGWIDFASSKAVNANKSVTGPPLTGGSGTGTLTGTDCFISKNQSTCPSTFTWDAGIATNPSLINVTRATTYSSASSGTSQNYNITFGPNTVELLDGAAPLQSITVTGSCTSGTAWDGTQCITASSSTLSITASPTRVAAGGTSTITWNADNAKNCAVTGPAGIISQGDAASTTHNFSGSSDETINAQSTFKINCVGLDDASASQSVIVNVNPSFQEF